MLDLLKKVGAEDAQAVQVGGPSGQMIGPDEYNRTVCYDDLGTGGSVMVFGPDRDLLEVVEQFLDFFVEETCGYCTPCRTGNVLLQKRLVDILEGRGVPEDIDYLQTLGESVKTMSRCGLGQTSANPVLSTLKNFRGLYEARLKERPAQAQPSFDIRAALAQSENLTGRDSVHFSK